MHYKICLIISRNVIVIQLLSLLSRLPIRIIHYSNNNKITTSSFSLCATRNLLFRSHLKDIATNEESPDTEQTLEHIKGAVVVKVHE
jgi:hypothetical protein